MSTQLSLYNPRSTPPEQLEAMLVGRDALLKELLDNLREQAKGQTRQHWLIRGPRGMGKTHLTGIIHHRVRSDPELSGAYLPLWLGEADVYEVYSPATLLERIAERLIEVVPEAKLAETLRTLEGGGDEEGFFEELSAHIAEEAERQGRILLVLMENLDALLEGFAPKERKAQLRQLRSLLLHDPHFLFISTTPTKYMSALTNPKEPLYNQFKERSLKPLTVEEVGAVFSKLAALTERKGMKELLEGPEAALRRKVIHQLTGGLPRSVVMAFEVMSDRTGIQPLVEDLRTLLDEQTAYFEARLRQLAPRERTIVTAMALAPKNLTLKEIAEKSRLPERSLSTLMSRLLQDGHVEVTLGSGGKGTVYGLSEGLFRLWYQYRKGRLLLEPLVKLLAYLFSATELQDTAAFLKERMAQLRKETRYSAEMALLQVEEALRLATSEEGQHERAQLWKECLDEVEAARATEVREELFTMIEQSLGTSAEADTGEPIDYANLAKHVLDAAATLPEAIALDCVGQLLLLTYSFGGPGHEKGLEFLQLLEHIFQGYDYPVIRKSVPMLHLFLGGRLEKAGEYQAALKYVEEAISHSAECGPHPYSVPIESAQWLRALILQKQGRTAEAIPAYKKFISEALQGGTPALINAAIQALFALAQVQVDSANPREAEEALHRVIELAENATDSSLRSILGNAKLMLIILEVERSNLPTGQTLEVLASWLEEFPEHWMRDDVRELHRVWRSALRAFDKLHPRAAVEEFLSDPSPAYAQLGARGVKQWLAAFERRGIDPQQAETLQLHYMVADALEAAALEEPGDSARLRQLLGQIPPELRRMVEELVEVERKRRDASARSPPTSPSRPKRRASSPRSRK
jgi:tetratricopeptide (TPR) repeat protein